MDDIVKRAMQKWPNVPHCYGWLALDARGEWYLRDEVVQADGPFPQVKGSRIEHDKLREFIARNYLSDDDGNWFFQNGPQRVYVALEAAPWVWRLTANAGQPPTIVSHTAQPARLQSVWLDDAGRMFLATDLGFGIVHTLDMSIAADAVEAAHWSPTDVRFDALPRRFGYRLAPAGPG